ncbi:transcriptional regulator [Psychrosphaera saromensis]|jgi:BolA protein|uniref:DNA-binding transcriptional regulator BolA n=1 Tax=Psychrosphaera saromensis TaxID=716813 RepID=A0A2S7UUQ4_9GAMM|nr:BolA/IbaG family iron-sulfur metabolism protein [Psychrosphaera saromensis]PQJ53242.1 BolA family transcriptional regulator [Psychrosphaera saromensis]GHB66890.1 transcriptional regulator [Psychrosphaera saromensis]GLQ14992.1 transcriptional regulator [Psychrosphaera saromensis]
MKIQTQITDKLNAQFSPTHLTVENESSQHNVPKGSESHFKVVVVSNEFAGKRLIQRHRLVNGCLADELANHIHALAIHTYTVEEWSLQFAAPDSPNCLGGSKGDETMKSKLN